MVLENVNSISSDKKKTTQKTSFLLGMYALSSAYKQNCLIFIFKTLWDIVNKFTIV